MPWRLFDSAGISGCGSVRPCIRIRPKWAADGKIEATVARVLSAEEMAKVKTFLEDPSLDQFINQEIALARKRQVSSTPTFFLYANGQEQKVVGKISYPILKDYLDRMLKSTR